VSIARVEPEFGPGDFDTDRFCDRFPDMFQRREEEARSLDVLLRQTTDAARTLADQLERLPPLRLRAGEAPAAVAEAAAAEGGASAAGGGGGGDSAGTFKPVPAGSATSAAGVGTIGGVGTRDVVTPPLFMPTRAGSGGVAAGRAVGSSPLAMGVGAGGVSAARSPLGGPSAMAAGKSGSWGGGVGSAAAGGGSGLSGMGSVVIRGTGEGAGGSSAAAARSSAALGGRGGGGGGGGGAALRRG
jgi:hypothetical protein